MTITIATFWAILIFLVSFVWARIESNTNTFSPFETFRPHNSINERYDFIKIIKGTLTISIVEYKYTISQAKSNWHLPSGAYWKYHPKEFLLIGIAPSKILWCQMRLETWFSVPLQRPYLLRRSCRKVSCGSWTMFRHHLDIRAMLKLRTFNTLKPPSNLGKSKPMKVEGISVLY